MLQAKFYRFIVLLGAVICFAATGCGSHQQLAGDNSPAPPAEMGLAQALAELDALETPPKADPATFAMLKRALRAALLARGTNKFTSLAPTGIKNQVTDIDITVLDGGPSIMRWTYHNLGDYNQNGKVEIYDLSTLGFNFGKNSSSPDWNSARLADGNGDGRIDAGDLVPLGINFYRTVKGHHLQYSPENGPNADWRLVRDQLLQSDYVFVDQVRICYAYPSFTEETYCCLQPGYYRVIPYDDESDGIASTEVYYDRGGLPLHYETENNDTYETADALPGLPVSGKLIAGNLGEGNLWGNNDGDKTDCFSFTVAHAGIVKIIPHTESSERSLELRLSEKDVHNSYRDLATIDDNGILNYFVTKPGTYYLQLDLLHDFDNAEYYLELEYNLNCDNLPPIAAIIATPSAGTPPLSVSFDSSASHDPNYNDPIVKYEYDFGEGNGYEDYDQDTSVEHIYTHSGNYLVKFRVTDSHGLTDVTSASVTTNGASSDTWRILIWYAGDNNIAPTYFEAIQQLENIGSTDNITILAGYDIYPQSLNWKGCEEVHFLKIVEDEDPSSINTSGDPANLSFARSGYDSSDPNHIREFVQWAEQFPAGHTMLILADHGGGWDWGTKSSASAALRDTNMLLVDNADGTNVAAFNQDIAAALSEYHFDLLFLDACLMGDIESLYDFRNVADYTIASPIEIFGSSTYLSMVINEWALRFPVNTTEAGGIVANLGHPSEPGNFCLFDNANVVRFAEALSGLTQLVQQSATTESEPLQRAICQTEFSGLRGSRDLKRFLVDYRSRTANTEIQSALDNCLRVYQDAVVYEDPSGFETASGLSAFLPDTDYLSAYATRYSQTSFSQATEWIDMLQATGAPPPEGIPDLSGDWQPGDILAITWDTTEINVDLRITNPIGKSATAKYPAELYHQVQFSSDNPGSGASVEYAVLQPDAPAGDYMIAILWNSDLYAEVPDPSASVKLYSGTGLLKQDYGQCKLRYARWRNYLVLTLK